MLIDKKIASKGIEIWIDEKGFLYLSIMEDVELDLETATKTFRIYTELGVGPENKVLQIIYAQPGSNISPEARKYVAGKGKLFFKASAIIGTALPIRLVVNFFNSFYKHEVPFKMFENESAAKKWLEGYR